MQAADLTNQWRAAGRLSDFAGHAVFVADSAPDDTTRPVIVLIHGFPTSSWDWHKIWTPLAADRRLVAPDLLGFGFSAKPRGHNYTIHEQADLVEAVAMPDSGGPLHLLAHDYGDSVAQELLARDNVRGEARRWHSVCLLNGGLFPETHRARPIQKLLLGPLGPLLSRLMNRQTLARNLRHVFGPETPPTELEIDVFWSQILHHDGQHNTHRLIRYMRDRREHRERWVDALRDSTAPIQLINGAFDPISGAHMVARYRELIGDRNIVSLERIGHYPQVEAPEAVVHHYLAFLARCEAA